MMAFAEEPENISFDKITIANYITGASFELPSSNIFSEMEETN